jgi:hypothetical protein
MKRSRQDAIETIETMKFDENRTRMTILAWTQGERTPESDTDETIQGSTLALIIHFCKGR